MNLRIERLRGFRVVLVAVVCGAALSLGLGPLGHAGASLSTCLDCSNAGPMITFADGTKLNVGTFVADSPQDIQAVAYTVHVPAGMGVTSIKYQGPNFIAQTVQVVADDSAGTFDTTTNVTTGAGTVAIYPYLSVNTPGVCQGSFAGSGLSNGDVSLRGATGC